jgi:signal transduction histidine kinase
MRKVPNRDTFMSSLRCRGEVIVLIISLALWLIPTTRLVIWKLAESNLFLVERTFFEGTFLTLGGPLDYLARALTTLLASGWTAMPSIALAWCLLTGLITTISGIKGHWFWLNAFPG